MDDTIPPRLRPKRLIRDFSEDQDLPCDSSVEEQEEQSLLQDQEWAIQAPESGPAPRRAQRTALKDDITPWEKDHRPGSQRVKNIVPVSISGPSRQNVAKEDKMTSWATDRNPDRLVGKAPSPVASRSRNTPNLDQLGPQDTVFSSRQPFDFEMSSEPVMIGDSHARTTTDRDLNPVSSQQPHQAVITDDDVNVRTRRGTTAASPQIRNPGVKLQHQLTFHPDNVPIVKRLGSYRATESTSGDPEESKVSSNKLANFFSAEVFQVVLHNPTTSHQLTKFCQSRFCGENMEFLEKLDRYNSLIDELGTTMLDIYRSFISVNAPSQLNLADTVLAKMNKDLKATLNFSLPNMESLFTEAQTNVEEIVFSDIYPRFVRSQLILSASKALANDRSKFAGLGDCFVLTNPAKADNPIVFASDGFVSVTGYSRMDIIPRNCRFLQGRHTDREAVGRLKMAIDGREESVELLLNYKKDKTPFWNLLYTAPLYDENGNVAFFIGGQINISTTIHSSSDILRILSDSEDVDGKEEKVVAAAPVKTPRLGNRLLKGLRGTTSVPTLGNVGMENALLNKIEKLTVKKQMETFQSAQYLVIKYDTMAINYFSMNIIDILYGTKPMVGHIVGVNIFNFLEQHAVNISRDFKSRVKGALKAGLPISLELNLSTRKFMRFINFVTHWTPLKGDDGKVEYVVLALGSAQILS